jgi:hypothetical protein
MKHLSSIIRSLLLTPLISIGGLALAYAHGNAGLEEGRLEVVLSEWSLGFEAVVVDAGTLPIHVVNEGKTLHNLVVAEAGTTAEISKTRLLSPGETAELSLEFSKDQYILYCSVPGHAEQGMLASSVVDTATAQEEPESGGGGYY